MLHEAEKVFSVKGFEETTVEEIASAADVAKGTFFNYFESKDALLGEILFERIASILEKPPSAGSPATMRIQQLLKRIWEEFYPYRHLVRRMFGHVVTHPRHARPNLTCTMADLVREGQAEGIFRVDIDPETAGLMIATYFLRLCIMNCLEDNDTPTCWEMQLEQGLDLLYNGLTIAL